MRVAFLSNTRSGRGLSRWAARAFPAALRTAGHEVAETAVGEPRAALLASLQGAGALVIAGGDGTVHRAAPDAIATGVPVYHIPCGNENLFARQFGMDRKIDTLSDALESPRALRVDAATVEDAEQTRPESSHADRELPICLLMCSVGPDAGVIRRLTALRTRAIGHLAYVEPVVRECLHPSFPPMTVEVDGRRVVDHARGTLLVANSRQYALRIDPARRADMTDGLLDVVFLPGKGPGSMALWGLWCRCRWDIERRGALYVTGRDIRISSPDPAPYQIDGDSPGWLGAGIGGGAPGGCAPLSLRISVLPSALAVLTPARGRP